MFDFSEFSITLKNVKLQLLFMRFGLLENIFIKNRIIFSMVGKVTFHII